MLSYILLGLYKLIDKSFKVLICNVLNSLANLCVIVKLHEVIFISLSDFYVSDFCVGCFQSSM